MITEYEGWNGQPIVIAEMTDNHLKNAIAYFAGKVAEYEGYLSAGYQMESSLQGEQALWEVEREMAQLEGALYGFDEILWALQHQQKTRQTSKSVIT